MKVFPHYYQFGIWDAEDKAAYPIVSTETDFVFGDKGVVILLDKEDLIDVSAATEKIQGITFKLTETEITVGSKGVEYGNLPASTVDNFDIPKGHYLVTLYGDNQDKNACHFFHFFLQRV